MARLRRAALFLLAGAVLLLRAAPARSADKAGACVACHREVGGVPYLEHDFGDWEKSAHAKAGVSCQSCHGGDASKADKAGAHAGLLPSAEAKSMVYFTRVPETCGACHQAEFAAFKKSAHFRELKDSGRGPNCVTCHGSMANHVLAPRELEMTCTLCHRRPTQAYAALMSLNNAGASLKRLKAALDAAKGAGVDSSGQEKAYKGLLARHRTVLEDWHTFRTAEVLRAAQEISKGAAGSVNELRLKGLKNDEDRKP